MSLATWDAGVWDRDVWQGHRERPGAGWGDAWRVWYQLGPAVVTDLTEMAVELRWTTDGHTMGDGTFRGDLSPGKAAIRFWDPGHVLEGLDKLGAVWASYTPTGATWCWFFDSIQRALVAPGDPSGADVVFNGLTWPARLIATNSLNNYPIQSINARLAAVVATMAGQTALDLPALTLTQDPAGQGVLATVVDTSWSTYAYPSYLDVIRDAATNGVAWWGYGRDAGGAGTLTLNYQDWDHVNPDRTLAPGQVVAGPPISSSIDWLITQCRFNAVRASDGFKSVAVNTGGLADKYGQQRLDMRLWGDTTAGEGAPASTTLVHITTDRGNPSSRYLSTVSLQSGPRVTADGRPSDDTWDPAAHVYSPLDVAAYTDPADHGLYRYRVTSSAHTLNAFSWQTTHTLEKFTAPTPLP